MSDAATRAPVVERLESRVLYAIVDADLHRPPLVMFATGDLNGDSIPDIVSLEKHNVIHRDLAARSKEDVYVWKVKTRLSDGHGGSLGIADEEVDMVANPLAVNIADLDGDGKPDIVITDASDTGAASLVDLPTDGKGHLVPRDAASGLPTGKRIALPTTVDPRATVAADLDGDGHVELSVFGFDPQPISAPGKALKPHPNVVVIYGADGRTPAGPRQTIPLDGLADYTAIATGDLTGDGSPDFAISDDSSNQLLIWSPRSNKMANIKNNPLYRTGQGHLLGIADLDGDGKMDLVATPGGNDLSLANLTDKGTLSPVRTTTGVAGLPATLARAPGVAIGDVNGDGRPDLVAAMGDGSVFVAINTSSKTASLPTFSRGFRAASLPIKWMAPESLTLADFDGDGKQDVLARLDIPTTTNQTRTEFAILLSRQTAAGDFYFERGDKPTQPQFATGDLNGDHKADLAVASADHVLTFDAAGIKEDVYVWKVRTYLGNGDGTFSKPVSTTTLDAPATALAIGDFDGDGKSDLVVLTPREAGTGIATGRRQYKPLRLFIGDGTGGLTGAGPGGGPHTASPLYDAHGLAVADLDRDGIDDLAVLGHTVKGPRDASSGQSSGRLLAAWILLGQRALPFSQSSLTPIGTPDDPTLGGADTILPAGDLDGDGTPDLIVSPRDHASGLPTGKRMAILSPVPGSGGGGGGGGILLSVKGGENPLFEGSGSSGTNPLYQSARLIAAGDVDGDGRPDLLAATDQGLFLSPFDVKSQSFLPPGPCKSSNTPTTLLTSTTLAADLDGDGKLDLLSFTSPTDYSAAFNTSTPRSPSYTWTLQQLPSGSKA